MAINRQREGDRRHAVKAPVFIHEAEPSHTYAVDLGLQELHDLRREGRALGLHRERVDDVLGRVVQHLVDRRVELAQQCMHLAGAGDS